ncbi:hypothetical protein PTTG_12606 [Puccinia triticina 1-1 BBBD Race 1]|uniref:Uncharacterized protein n=1 Tax=Puccinia triticina (isolate 1-1 / race 1 (BBBD)) TaxID=630390 RepID=A0A180GHB0_PUCT1|nr:hypothetical protein PTTG_12606 [Puccinia triticina 1-1 BBBD Race 1]
MSSSAEVEDDISSMFKDRENPSGNNDQNPPSPSRDTVHHENNHTNIFDENENQSDHEEPDQRMADLDDPMDTLIEELQNSYHLNEKYSSISIKSLKCPEEERYARTLFALTSICQSLEAGPSKGSSNHQCPDYFKDFVRETAKSFIGRTDVEAYTATLDKHSDPLTLALLKSTTDVANKQTQEFKDKYYPEGHDGTNLEAKSEYGKVMVALVKHIRGQLRDLLLTQILTNKKVKPTGPVPPIDELIQSIVKDLLPKQERTNYSPIAITWRMRI